MTVNNTQQNSLFTICEFLWDGFRRATSEGKEIRRNIFSRSNTFLLRSSFSPQWSAYVFVFVFVFVFVLSRLLFSLFLQLDFVSQIEERRFLRGKQTHPFVGCPRLTALDMAEGVYPVDEVK